MPETKTPWRTLVTGGPTGRFTREQIRKAVIEVKAESDARAREARLKRRAAKAARRRAA
ncbi:hypothetical protein [Longimicrobium sp.]|uniref:hypothetical protein n=1 Tax=Longimicrobium sp. TaxID=2029185 RepID=UPI003B3BB0EC